MWYSIILVPDKYLTSVVPWGEKTTCQTWPIQIGCSEKVFLIIFSLTQGLHKNRRNAPTGWWRALWRPFGLPPYKYSLQRLRIWFCWCCILKPKSYVLKHESFFPFKTATRNSRVPSLPCNTETQVIHFRTVLILQKMWTLLLVFMPVAWRKQVNWFIGLCKEKNMTTSTDFMNRRSTPLLLVTYQCNSVDVNGIVPKRLPKWEEKHIH